MIGDILSCTVRADGWSVDVVIEGFTTGAAYDFGSFDDVPATVSDPRFTLNVVSEGYNAAGALGTINRTVYGTHVVRKPYPDQASKDETAAGNLTVRVALSESVYNDDKNGGAGTSGTNPTVTITAGWCVNSGGGAQSSAAATALAVTNNSTLDYPKVIAQWAWGHTPAWRRVTADTSIGCIAYHGHGVACVALSAVEGANSVTGTATTKTAHLMSASGLYYESYDLAVPVASFTNGNAVTLKFIAYPTVGDADSIIDTSTNTTALDDVRGLTQITFTKNPTVTTMYVAQNGNDTTGNGSTATPYATIGKALAQGAGIVYVQAGGTNVVDFIGTSPASVTQVNYFIDVLPKPGDEGTVSLTRTSAGLAWKAKLLRYSGFTISGGNAYLDGGSRVGAKLWFENCTMSVASAPTTGVGYASQGAWFINCTESSGIDDFKQFSSNINGYCFSGCSFSSGAKIWKSGSVVACKLSGSGTDKNIIEGNNNGAQTLIENNSIFCNNKAINSVVNANVVMTFGKAANTSGCAIVGNLIEVKTITSSQCGLWVAGDPNTVTSENFIVAHNTVIGERCNLFYNDTGVTSYLRSNVFVRNNAFRAYNIKTDTFAPASANRIGNWAQVNGVNYSDNRFDGTNSAAFTNDWDGINTSFVTAKDSTYGQLGYTADRSNDGTGTGNGDYMPTLASPLYNHALQVCYLKYDQNGTALY